MTKKTSLDHSLLEEFFDIFVTEILGIPPKREIDFRIDLVAITELVS